MDGGAVVVILAGLGAIIAWIIAGFKSYQLGKNPGLMQFILNLFGSFIAIFILWLLIVYPTFGCDDLFCGLGEAVIWFLSSLLLFLVWPIILILYFNKRYRNNRTIKTRQNDDLLDDSME